MITKININATRVDTGERKLKLERVTMEMHRILNSQLFRDKVIMMKPWGETSKWKGGNTVAIYNHIMSGAEALSPEQDYEIDIYVDDYYSLKKVIGYTYKNTKYQYVNTRYFDKRQTDKIGANILHEYGHKLGFGHDFRRTKRRPHSICYLLGDIYIECYRKLMGNLPQTVKVCRRSWKTLWLKKTCFWREV